MAKMTKNSTSSQILKVNYLYITDLYRFYSWHGIRYIHCSQAVNGGRNGKTTLPELGVDYESIRKLGGYCFGYNRGFSLYSTRFIWVCDILRDRGICYLAATRLDNCHFG